MIVQRYQPPAKELIPSRETWVRERAYLKWEQAGRPEGMSEHFWSAASRDYDALVRSLLAPKPVPPLHAMLAERLSHAKLWMTTAWCTFCALLRPSLRYS